MKRCNDTVILWCDVEIRLILSNSYQETFEYMYIKSVAHSPVPGIHIRLPPARFPPSANLYRTQRIVEPCIHFRRLLAALACRAVSAAGELQ